MRTRAKTWSSGIALLGLLKKCLYDQKGSANHSMMDLCWSMLSYARWAKFGLWRRGNLVSLVPLGYQVHPCILWMKTVNFSPKSGRGKGGGGVELSPIWKLKSLSFSLWPRKVLWFRLISVETLPRERTLWESVMSLFRNRVCKSFWVSAAMVMFSEVV